MTLNRWLLTLALFALTGLGILVLGNQQSHKFIFMFQVYGPLKKHYSLSTEFDQEIPKAFTGNYRWWNRDGLLLENWECKDGKKHGKALSYTYLGAAPGDETGVLYSQEQYKNGKLHGIAKAYEGSTVISENSYLNGLQIGLQKEYSEETGKLIEQYTNGNDEDYVGFHYWYGDDGRLNEIFLHRHPEDDIVVYVNTKGADFVDRRAEFGLTD